MQVQGFENMLIPLAQLQADLHAEGFQHFADIDYDHTRGNQVVCFTNTAWLPGKGWILVWLEEDGVNGEVKLVGITDGTMEGRFQTFENGFTGGADPDGVGTVHNENILAGLNAGMRYEVFGMPCPTGRLAQKKYYLGKFKPPWNTIRYGLY